MTSVLIFMAGFVTGLLFHNNFTKLAELVNSISSTMHEKKSPMWKPTPEQKQAIKILENPGNNLLITGRAGTGKTTFLNQFRAASQKNMVLVAPTGIAALNMQGSTIHSFFKLPPRLILLHDKDDMDEAIQVDYSRSELFKKLELLIVDEISMVRADVFTAMDKFLKLNRHNDLPFGGVQVILCGDPFQLPPVVVGREISDYFEENYKGPYFFNSPAFAEGNFKHVQLTEIFRQKGDTVFIDLLNAIRDKTCGDQQLALLNSRYIPENKTSKHPALTLCATNKIALDINTFHMDRIKAPLFTYEATIKGEFINTSNKDYPADQTLALKAGAQVIMLKNDPSDRWQNGTLGIVSKLEDDKIFVNINGADHEINRESWKLIDYEYNRKTKRIKSQEVGEFIQYPLKAAWAITIHKSQGQTFDKININLGRGAFTHGQLYVALSRCTSLAGITLKSRINHRDVMVDPRVINFMRQTLAATRQLQQ